EATSTALAAKRDEADDDGLFHFGSPLQTQDLVRVRARRPHTPVTCRTLIPPSYSTGCGSGSSAAVTITPSGMVTVTPDSWCVSSARVRRQCVPAGAAWKLVPMIGIPSTPACPRLRSVGHS